MKLKKSNALGVSERPTFSPQSALRGLCCFCSCASTNRESIEICYEQKSLEKERPKRAISGVEKCSTADRQTRRLAFRLLSLFCLARL